MSVIFTEPQRRAIEAEPGAHLVLAGPGAGKTLCIIERIRHLVEVRGFAAGRICVVTFTNKAAGEIAERLRTALDLQADEVTRGTIHSLCVGILRSHGSAIGLRRGFGIADENYQVQVLRRLGIPRDEWARGTLSRFSAHRLGNIELKPGDAELFPRYVNWLRDRNMLDFDDIVLRARDLLVIPEVRDEVASRWDYLLVDEAQDLSQAQFEVLQHLASPHRRVFAVGDDEQSIFSWAGADPTVLRRLLNEYGLTEAIVLDENRRCSAAIFTAARRLLAPNPVLFQKPLKATRESPWPVMVEAFPDDDAESAWLLADLQADRAEHKLTWGDVGILYRTHEIGSRIEGLLMQAGIPSRLAVGRALQDDPVVRYLRAALDVIASPSDPLHAEALAAVVLPRNQFQQLRAEAERTGTDLLTHFRVVSRQGKADEAIRKVRRLLFLLDNLRALGEKHTSLAGLVEELLSQRVGEYKTLLEERQDELSDPASDPAVVALADELATALHGRRRVRIARLGGLEIALAGMLRGGGITSVEFLERGQQPAAGDLVFDPATAGAQGPALGLFKALQYLHARNMPDAFRDFVAFDLETTDSDVEDCQIVEIAAVRVRDGVITDEFHRLVRPEVPIAPKAREQHGYEEAMLAGEPLFAEVWPEFQAFVGGDVLVAHNGHWFDFPVLERMSGGASRRMPVFDTLPLARELHSGSAKLGDLAEAFGIGLDRAHHALDDSRALAHIFRHLEQLKQARGRKVALVNLLDWLGLSLALADSTSLTAEAGMLHRITRIYALGRYSDCLQQYAVERERPGASTALTLDDVIERLGGREKMAQVREQRTALDRYPAAMTRLARVIDGLKSTTLEAQLVEFRETLALARSEGVEHDMDRVNLLTLHATKGLEFSRVYVVGVEDGQLPGLPSQHDLTRTEVEEARRLLYVGMTRAMDRLVLTRAAVRNGKPTGGTRFLDEMGLAEGEGGSVKGEEESPPSPFTFHPSPLS